MLRALLIGCGFIGRILLENMEKMNEIDEVLVFDAFEERSKNAAEKFSKASQISDPLESMKDVNLVIEAASQDAVREFGVAALSMGKDLMIMSVGALGDDSLREQMFSYTGHGKGNLFIPSGAIFGTSGLASAASAHIDSVLLETFKPPAGLKGADYMVEHDLNPDSFEKRTLIFEGTARDAVKAFPKNVNVSATLSLLGLGFDKTKVQVFIDPKIERNIHRVMVRGDFGKAECTVENLPSPENPRTSYLAALSAAATLRKIVSGRWIGI